MKTGGTRAKANIDGTALESLISERADAYLDIAPHISLRGERILYRTFEFSTEATTLGFASLGHRHPFEDRGHQE